MACATLKRNYEWDPLQSQSPGGTPKRRRCGSAYISPVTKLHRPSDDKPTPFGDVSTKLTSEQIATNIRDEIKKLHRRKQLRFDGDNTTSSSASCSSTSATSLSSTLKQDKPLFTFQHIRFICEKMLKDRENEIRDEYDRILNTKLAEQYDTFVKFTYDQIQKRFENCTPSYLS